MKLKELFWGAVFVTTFSWFIYAMVSEFAKIVNSHAREMETRRAELKRRRERLVERQRALDERRRRDQVKDT